MVETNFELKNVTSNSRQIGNVVENNYDVNFERDGEIRTISLNGTGKLKETVKI